MNIGNHEIKDFGVPYIIAEIGANHNGDMTLAKQMIIAAKSCGCDAVKFQSWTPESLIAKEEYDRNQQYDDSPKKHFGSLRDMVEKYYLRPAQHVELKAFCDKNNIEFCSTPFSQDEADFLNDEIKVSFFKIASMDINNPDFISYVAKKQKPVLLSTGMASLAEIENAVKIIEDEGNYNIVLLHCISIYPPRYEDIHLNNIPMLRNAFGYPIGFSDHTIGVSIPIASIALGACLIEKHFTIDKDMPGWDHEISADPQEMKFIVNESRNVANSLGSSRRIVSQDEKTKQIKFRRSIVASTDLKKGDVVTRNVISYKRPGSGISPDKAAYVIGRVLNRDINSDELILWNDLV